MCLCIPEDGNGPSSIDQPRSMLMTCIYQDLLGVLVLFLVTFLCFKLTRVSAYFLVQLVCPDVLL
jgi:hypothetical protein